MTEQNYEEYLNNRLSNIIQEQPRNYCAMKADSNYYLVNGKTGKIISDPYFYLDCDKSYGDFIMAKLSNNLRGVIDYEGRKIIPPKFEYIEIKGGMIRCDCGNEYKLYDKNGYFLYRKPIYSSTKIEEISYNFSYVHFIGGLIYDLPILHCTTMNRNGYIVKKKFKKFECIKDGSNYIVKYYPLRIYNNRYTLCIDWSTKNLYLFDKNGLPKREYHFLGDINHVEFRDRFIFINGLDKFEVYLIYNENLFDISNYYVKRFGCKYKNTIKIVDGEALLTEREFQTNTSMLYKDNICEWKDDHWEIKDEFREAKRWLDNYIDNFDNVKLENINFDGCRVVFRFQRLYKKSLRGCSFEGATIGTSSLITDFTGVDIRDCVFKEEVARYPKWNLLYNPTLEYAIYDDTTMYNGIPLTRIVGSRLENKNGNQKTLKKIS